MKILYVSSEVEPFAKTGGLADVAGSLPLYLAKGKDEAAVVQPFYRLTKSNLAKKGLKAECVIFDLQVQVGHEIKKANIHKVFFPGTKVPVYLIENDFYYDRPELYGEKGQDYPDNCARFTFFCRAILEMVKKLKWKPSVINCNDWQSALIPMYLKTLYKSDPFFAKTATVYTIHNMAHLGLFAPEEILTTGLGWEYFNSNSLEFWNKLCLMKAGIIHAELVTTVSQKYSQEIQTEEYGCGLDGLLRTRNADIYGIVNGIDYKYWGPSVDKDIAASFSAEDLGGKLLCKKELQKIYKLPAKPDVPVLGLISRLSNQKGFDILAASLENLLKLDLQFVLLGTGDPAYHELFARMAEKYPKKVGIALRFDSKLSRQIYAGSDMFLMPSKFEPCGLGQMISFAYGTIPIVRATGGLADTVEDYNTKSGKGTGFVFSEYTAEALTSTVKRALKAFGDKDKWAKLSKKAIQLDYSWDKSAIKYKELYKIAIKKLS